MTKVLIACTDYAYVNNNKKQNLSRVVCFGKLSVALKRDAWLQRVSEIALLCLDTRL